MTRTDMDMSASSRSSYWLAGTVAAVGVVAAIVWGGLVAAGAVGAIDDLPRGEVPGDLSLVVEEPGEHTIFYERRTFTATTPLAPEIDVRVTDPDGESVPLEPYDTALTYRLWRLVGQAHATFETTTTGQHTVHVEGAAPEDATIAVTTDAPTHLMSRFLLPGLLLVATLIAAAVIAVRGRATHEPSTPKGTDHDC